MNDDDKMIEDQAITMGQPLSDFLLQLEDYTPTVNYHYLLQLKNIKSCTLISDSRCSDYLLYEKLRF